MTSKTTKSNLTWKEDMSFEAELGSHRLVIDAKEDKGGKNRGPSPKSLLLTALSGCTAMDVISILKKMKITPESFEVSSEAKSTDEHPKHYDEIKLIYKFKGKNLNRNRNKIEKAVSLSIEKYCGVSFMLSKSSTISTEIEITE